MCIFAKLRDRWKKKTSINKEFRRSWLVARPTSSAEWGVGCKICAWAKGRKQFVAEAGGRAIPARSFADGTVHGASMHLGSLRRHALTQAHVLAVPEYLKAVAGDSSRGLPLGSAPPVEDFIYVYCKKAQPLIRSACRRRR